MEDRPTEVGETYVFIKEEKREDSEMDDNLVRGEGKQVINSALDKEDNENGGAMEDHPSTLCNNEKCMEIKEENDVDLPTEIKRLGGRLFPFQVSDPISLHRKRKLCSSPVEHYSTIKKMNTNYIFDYDEEEAVAEITEKMAFDSGEEEVDSDVEEDDEILEPPLVTLSVPSAAPDCFPGSSGIQTPVSAMGSDFDVQSLHWMKKSEVPPKFKKCKFLQPSCGPSNSVHVDISSPKSIFSLFFTKYFTDFIIQQSDLYASQNYATLNLEEEELFAFLGILILMGIHTLPSIRLYWSNNTNFKVERIANIMPEKRFLTILKFLHLNDSEKAYPIGHPQFDKLYKIRPMISHLNEKFKEMFHPSRWLSIDESTIKFKGKSAVKQYMPLNPVEREFKVWVLCCSESSYALNMGIYTGKCKTSRPERIVEEAIVPYMYKGYGICFNNFFSSIHLADSLLRKNIFCCGSLCSDRREFPKSEMKADKDMKRGEFDFIQSEDISVIKWKDKGSKPLCILTTMHNPEETILKTWIDDKGGKTEIKIPKAISDYNDVMGGVDHFDKLMSMYTITWKSRRWWMNLFYYFVDTAIVNSYILYKQICKDVNKPSASTFLTHLQFRSRLADELIGEHSSSGKAGKSASVRFYNVGDHLPIKLPTKNRACAGCSLRRIRRQSFMGCKKCEVALCLDCFESYHTRDLKK